MMNFLNSVWGFIVAIGLLVTIHELGHYLVMRWCGVRVLRFAFGFGKTLWSRTDKSGTEWAICLWPLGGYVKPLDTREESGLTVEQRSQAFDTQPVGKRIAMVAAGPIANFLLALLLYWVVFLNGITEWRPILAAPSPDTPAAAAGIRAGDMITRVDGRSVDSWSDAQWQLIQRIGKESSVTLAVVATEEGTPVAGDKDRGVELQLPQDVSLGPATLGNLGLKLANPPLAPIVGQVQPESAAAKAGLMPGDQIRQIDNHLVSDWFDFVQQVRTHPDQTLTVQIERQGQPLSLALTPAKLEEHGQLIGRAGVSPQPGLIPAAYKYQKALNPAEALAAAVTETYEKSRFTLVMLGQMIIGKASLDNLSGPISIASAAGQTVRIGLDAFLRFLAIVSLSLGVINLIPLPLLDGGHLLYYFVEILTGKPVSAERQALFHRFGVVLLGSLMFIAVFNDLQRLFNW
jgi:regulator of sigma E protease